MKAFSCFKAYDIRGRVPDELTADMARALGAAFAQIFNARNVVIGRDVRLSGPELRAALTAGLCALGAGVTDLGVCGTEEIYHAVARHAFDGGIMITGSHNPADENGFKLLRAGAVPVSADSGLRDLESRVADLLGCSECIAGGPDSSAPSSVLAHPASFRAEYVRWLLEYSRMDGMTQKGRMLKIVADAGNGCAGPVLGDLAAALPFDFVLRQTEPDGHFPNGVPNPLLPERRQKTAAAVRETGADLGIAFDGDFDRCFFYDSDGNFIEGYYCVGILAEEMLRRFPGGKILYDTRAYWNTRDIVLNCGGRPVMGKTGHAFMKEKMREIDAVYGGEMSAHHYFRDFAYCDSGMLPWLLTAALLMRTGRPLAELAAERMAAYPCSGEINRRVGNAGFLIKRIRDKYAAAVLYQDQLDGINMEFPGWRFNLRMSNTEPILRLNVESRGDRALLEDKTVELLDFIDAEGTAQSVS
ncbi:MAG: phosphomannomutase [Desulfovibrio sp.]|jgi:phosphomannomutase|nr:phosphomannomutase [Desulfovibrio sp.]